MNIMGRFKKSEKLPRGSYFYVQVGHRFYAGERLVAEETTKTTEVKAPAREVTDRHWWFIERKIPRSKRLWWRTRHGLHIPKYLQSRKVVTTERQLTGERETVLTDNVNEVKKFRRLEQAQKACEKLEALYVGFDVKVTVKLFEGGTK